MDRQVGASRGKFLPRAYNFDGDNTSARCRTNRRDARPRRLPVDVNRACAAKARATAEFRTGHAQDIAQRPYEWRVVGNSEVAWFTAYVESDHLGSSRGPF